jgi:hypothetical protein
MLRYAWFMVALLVVLSTAVGARSADAISYDPEERQFLQLINEYRANNGLEPLTLSDTLSVSSERHSQDMAEYGFFAHDTVTSSYYPAGSRPWDRMAAEGYDYNTFKGENIAAGYETAEESFQAWRESPSHNHAMLDANYRAIGIGRVNVPGSIHGWYWTTDFGGVLDPTSRAPANGQPAQDPPEEPKEPLEDLGGIENGKMDGESVWRQKAEDGANLILDDGYARLGGYNVGRDDLRQKIRVREKTDLLAYGLKVETDEEKHPFDLLLVRLTDRDGKQLAVLERYTDRNTGKWRREKVNLSRFVGRTVYLSFYVETDPTRLTTFYLDNVVVEDRTPAPRSESRP